MIDTQAIRQRWKSVGSKLDERGRRLFAAGEVRAAGWGGLEAVSEITGLARSTIGQGSQRPRRCAPAERPGASQGWRPAASVEPGRDADRGSAQRHRAGHARRPHAAAVGRVSKRLRQGGPDALQEQGREISASSVEEELLPTLGYSRQSNRKADEGSEASRPQCAIRAHQRQGDRRPGCRGSPSSRSMPRRRTLIGNYKNGGGTGLSPERRSAAREGARLRGQGARQGRTLWRVRRWRQCRLGERRDHKRHGISCRRHSIRRWLDAMGRERYPAREG